MELIKTFTKDNVRTLRAELQPILDNFAAAHGLKSLRLGNITLTKDEFSSKLTALVQGDPFDESKIAVGQIYGLRKSQYTITEIDWLKRIAYAKNQNLKLFNIPFDQLATLKRIL